MGVGCKKDKRVKQTGELEESEIKTPISKKYSEMSGNELREELSRFDAMIDSELQPIYMKRESALKEKDAAEKTWRESIEKEQALQIEYDAAYTRLPKDDPEVTQLWQKHQESLRNRMNLYEKYDDKRDEFNKIDKIYHEKRNERTAPIREWFYTESITNPKIVINIDESSKLYQKYGVSRIEPQKEFLEKVFVNAGKRVAFTAIGEEGGGAYSSGALKRVVLGEDYGGETDPLHEFMHQAEEQLGIESARSRKMIEYLEAKTGKKHADIEVREWVYDIDSKGKKKKRGKYLGSKIWVPKDLFPEPGSKEEKDWGYMFRLYDRQVSEKHTTTKTGKIKTKRYIRPVGTGWGDDYGTEVMEVAIENIYKHPIDFSKKHPEIFDMVVDLMRGKIK